MLTGTGALNLVSMMILNEGLRWSYAQLFVAKIKRIAHMYVAQLPSHVVAVRSDQVEYRCGFVSFQCFFWQNWWYFGDRSTFPMIRAYIPPRQEEMAPIHWRSLHRTILPAFLPGRFEACQGQRAWNLLRNTRRSSGCC